MGQEKMMQRAIVISVLVHVLLLSANYENLLLGGKRELITSPLAMNALLTGEEQKASKENIPLKNEYLPVKEEKAKIQQRNQASEVSERYETYPLDKNAHTPEKGSGPHSMEVSERQNESISSASVSRDGLRQYGINVAREARKNKIFPTLARQKGWEGEVDVGIDSAQGVNLPVVSLNKSSGHEILDQAAVEMVRLAVRDAALPFDMQGKAFAMTLPVRFSLGE